MTLEEWNKRQSDYESDARLRGVDEMTIYRMCWWCRDTSQCDGRCFRVAENVYERKETR